MGHMETMINRLSEIEGAAVRTEELAAEKKKAIAAEYRRKTNEFDKQVDERTKRELQELTERLEREAGEELQKMRREMESELSGMEREYHENHKELAANLARMITGA